MTAFTCLLGEPALSDFRKRKLQRRIDAVTGGGHELAARFVYLVECAAEPETATVGALERLLQGRHVAGLMLIIPSSQKLQKNVGCELTYK